MGKVLDLHGRRFGNLVVLRLFEVKKKAFWVCECSCGSESIISGCNLSTGNSSKCRQCADNGRVLAFDRNSKNTILREYKRGASDRNLIWSLSFENFIRLISSNCFYCGCSPSNVIKTRSGKRRFLYSRIDRVDNLLGYEEGNVVSCCKVCNRAKDTMSFEKFNNWISNVFTNLRDRNDGFSKSFIQ